MKILLNRFLAINLILLFVGVSFSSAIFIDADSRLTDDKGVEDFGSNEVSDADFLKLKNQLDKLERYSKLLLVLSRNNPEIRDMYKELSELITYENNWKFPVFCYILEDIFCLMNDTISFILEIYEKFPYGGILYQIAVTIGGIAVYISVYVVLPIAQYFGCDWISYPAQILREYNL